MTGAKIVKKRRMRGAEDAYRQRSRDREGAIGMIGMKNLHWLENASNGTIVQERN